MAMGIRFVAALTGAAGVILAGQAALAKDVEIRRSLKSGETAELLQHSSMRGNCESKVPQIKILSQPSNGAASVKEGERKFQNGKGNFAKCDGKTGVAARVVYKPREGFTGTDKLRYEVTFASGNVSTYVVTLRVGSTDTGGWTKAK